MGCSDDGDIWTDHCIVAHINVAIIHAGQVIIGIDHFSKMAVMPAKVCEKRRFNVNAFATVSEQFC